MMKMHLICFLIACQQLNIFQTGFPFFFRVHLILISSNNMNLQLAQSNSFKVNL
mgnify:CR=1 FL=1